MSDDEFGDLLDGLDNELPPKKETTTIKKSVNFLDQVAKIEEKSEMRPARSTLDDLFGTTPSAAPEAPGRRQNLNFLFNDTPKPRETNVPESTPTTVPIAHPPATDGFEAGRIARLETELERVNRELEDTKRKKREDEEDLENFWKNRLETQNRENSKNVDDLKSVHRSQLSQIQEEQKVEIERLKRSFDLQLETMTSSTHQIGDLAAVVGKVDLISRDIDKIAADVKESTSKVSSEQSALLQIQEEKLKIREEKYHEEMASLKSEQLKVHELNLKLNDLLKKHEDLMEKEKWKVKEEWNRLKAERQIFKDDQKHVLDNLQREKINLAKSVKNFHESQHEILVRVSQERQLFEQERNEFLSKRDQDIKRIKSEAYELELKIHQITLAEENLSELKLSNDTKMRQLTHLEQLLSAECAEIERMRTTTSEFQRRRPVSELPELPEDTSRKESVRASLRKHYDYLDKYAGQKVAAVAPQNN